ncbi:hypothetical protein B9J87_10710 [Vibrio sp. V19_P1S1T109]|uniref:hypothetical protein n=1 Tax=Vibrio sp. V19_P1S1T109 TaxID=1938672 RepID=UPI000B8E97BE|nr:hypothetical protein [Vibrio sp. V19_P1S1T109]OXX71312.1 hypothetical protein B9J87_10710 [Vibrio sp. V19_P1S1T109]
MIHVFFEKNGVLSAQEKLSLLMLPPKKRARLLWRVAAKVRDGSKMNISRQQNPEEGKWAKRKKRRSDGKRKMLTGMMPLIVVSDKQSNENKAIVTLKSWKGTMKSRAVKKMDSRLVGNAHQKGFERRNNGRSSPSKSIDPKSICTRKEAKLLKNLNFSVWARRVNPDAKQGKRVKPPIKWIADNVTYKEFRRWVTKAREEGAIKSKSNWKIPARKFLGVSKQKYRKAWERAFQGINYGWQVKAQDIK